MVVGGESSRTPPLAAAHRRLASSAGLFRRGPVRTDRTIFAGKILGRRAQWAVKPLSRHGWRSGHRVGVPSKKIVRFQRHFGLWGSFLGKNCKSIVGKGSLLQLQKEANKGNPDSPPHARAPHRTRTRTQHSALCTPARPRPVGQTRSRRTREARGAL